MHEPASLRTNRKKKKKRIVSRVLRERWLSLWPQFLTLNILIQFELPLSFFRWSIPGESRVGYSGRDGWAFGHSFWRYTFWFNLSYHCLFFGDRFQVSLEITNPMSRILLTWVSVIFLIFSPEGSKQHVEEMKSQYSRKTTVEIGVTITRRLKRTLKPSRLDIFVIKQINTLHKD